jgi:uncharacterized DUF497 family protein
MPTSGQFGLSLAGDEFPTSAQDGARWPMSTLISRPFKWGNRKAESNLRKHDVSFDEAATAFDDPLCVAFSDPDHAVEEDRFILMGESTTGRLLVVSYTERSQGIRLISARKATLKERIAYEEEI